MDLKEYLKFIGRRKWLIVLVTLATVVVTVGVSVVLPKVYEAHTTLMVGEGQLSSKDYLGEVQASEQMAKGYSSIMTSPTILRKVRQSARLNMSISDLSSKITVEPVVETPLIRITVADASRDRARTIATKLAEVFVKYTGDFYEQSIREADHTIKAELEQVEAELAKAQAKNNTAMVLSAESRRALILSRYEDLLAKNPSARVKIIEPAELPDQPASPRLLLNGVLSLVVGLWIGLGVAVAKEQLSVGN